MTERTEAAARAWVDAHSERLKVLERTANLAAWEAATSGSEEALTASAAARSAVRRLYCNAADATAVREFLGSPAVVDSTVRRELTLLDLRYTENQLPEEVIEDLTARESDLERIFYTFRPEFEGSPASNNELLEVLRKETDSGRRRAAWEASKKISHEIAPGLRDLVRKRNAAARDLGFENYHSMQLGLEEIDEDVLFSTLDEFRVRSDDAFARIRADIDAVLGRKYGLEVGELYPWHWEDFFSQEAPSVGEVDLDPLFRGRSLEAIASDYFVGIGLPADDVLDRSDLYERPSKDQHAFCTDIDREGDVRILCNLRDTERWMGTLLHELGHAVYDKFIPSSLPYLLRRAGHTMLTEAVAMYMGRLTRNPIWLHETLGVEIDARMRDDVTRQLGWSMLVSARWILVMVYFERELYRDPDREDLNVLWWDLVESIQMVKRPPHRDAPDWAAKLHLSLAPVYYHNYLLGEFTASQFAGTIRASAGTDSPRDPAVGAFFRDRLFAEGASMPWNQILEKATGSTLDTEFFVRDFVTPAA